MGLCSAPAAPANFTPSTVQRDAPCQALASAGGRARDTELLQPTQHMQASPLGAWQHRPSIGWRASPLAREPYTSVRPLVRSPPRQLPKALLPHLPAWLAAEGSISPPSSSRDIRWQQGAAGNESHAGRRAFMALPPELSPDNGGEQDDASRGGPGWAQGLSALPPSSPATP
jgi:hypothetical protein